VNFLIIYVTISLYRRALLLAVRTGTTARAEKCRTVSAVRASAHLSSQSQQTDPTSLWFINTLNVLTLPFVDIEWISKILFSQIRCYRLIAEMEETSKEAFVSTINHYRYVRGSCSPTAIIHVSRLCQVRTVLIAWRPMDCLSVERLFTGWTVVIWLVAGATDIVITDEM
jgi:hypothetical protein